MISNVIVNKLLSALQFFAKFLCSYNQVLQAYIYREK